jgi:hypothetical protein
VKPKAKRGQGDAPKMSAEALARLRQGQDGKHPRPPGSPIAPDPASAIPAPGGRP